MRRLALVAATFLALVSAQAQAHRVIVFVWDGMRPDAISEDDTPHLAALAKQGTFFADNHATYPTFTMINASSFATGSFPVAEEAVVTLKVLGNNVDPLYDVGVAGLHRLLDRRDRLTSARVIIVVAGMEGALPSVVGGLVSAPVIAVPTSIGYGASFGGVAALLGMLNSCASNVTVVNIDNGFGAAMFASLINRI